MMEKEYTDSQKKAIAWTEGPVVVLAGPGSGKTAVLTERIRRIIYDTKDETFRILALTFTNKAASEMRERVSEGKTENERRLFIGTFHSFCSEVLRNHGTYIGVKSDFDIYSSTDDLNDVIDDLVREYNENHSPIEATDYKLLNAIQFFEKNLCITEEDVIRVMPNSEAIDIYKWFYFRYLAYMKSKGTLDFDMLILLAYTLFSTKATIARIYAKTYKYICVDEFQDTNYGQYMLLKSMCGVQNRNIYVVADDDQVIYGWNGASHLRITEFKSEYGAEVIQLNQNFRCPKEVIELANKLISHNSGRTENKKPLEAMKTMDDNSEHCSLAQYSSDVVEVNEVINSIESIRKSSPNDSISVIARNNRLIDIFYKEAKGRGISCEKAAKKNEFETPYVLLLYLLLKLANHRNDIKILKHIVAVLSGGLDIEVNLEQIVLQAEINDSDFLKAMRETETINCFDERMKTEISSLLIEGKSFIDFISCGFEWAARCLATINDEEIREQALQEFAIEKKVWEEFNRNLSYQYDLREITLATYMQEFSMVSKEAEPRADAVQFLTIHASKGKEFDHVFLVGMVNDELPSFQSLKKGEKSVELEEERRNCFVAITRAKKALHMSYASSYFGWNKKPSIFLYEMNE